VPNYLDTLKEKYSDDLTENERDAYEERSAIIEEGNIGMSRYEAERRAMKAVMDRRKLI
jgi:hypothetical protein